MIVSTRQLSTLFFILIFFSINGQNGSAYLESLAIDNLRDNKLIMGYDRDQQDYECLNQVKSDYILDFTRFLSDPLSYYNEDHEISQSIQSILNIDFQTCKDPDDPFKLFEDYKNINVQPSNEVETDTNTGYTLTTSLIDGTAKFLVNRTKKEIALTFYENFQSKINRDYYVTIYNGEEGIKVYFKLSDIFPNTTLLLNNKDSFNTPSLGQTWIAAFKQDIAKMPEQLMKIILNSSFVNSEIGQSIQVSFELINLIKDGNSLERTISLLSDNYNAYNNYDLHRIIGLLDMTLFNLKDENGKIIDYNTFRNLSSDNKIILIGLLMNKLKSEEIIPADFILDKKTVREKIIPIFLKLTNEIENISKQVKLIYDADGNFKLDSFLNFATSSLELSLTASQMAEEIFNFNNEELKLSTNYLIEIISPVKSIYTNFGEKDYGAALLTTINFLDSYLIQNERNEEVKRLVSYYGNFLVDIINAAQKDSTVKVEDVLNSYALPVSSYRIKRQFHNSLDISAYPGIYGGYEFSNSKSFSFGLTAPIGISYSWKSNQNLSINKQSNSNSIFLSAIDLGAPFSYRFSNDDAEGLPENIKWDQIFAPGLFYVKGFKNSPFAISVGGQFSPLLRNIKNNMNEFDEENIFRFSVSLTVDIPLFNLKRKSKSNTTSSVTSTDVLYGDIPKLKDTKSDTFQIFYDKNGHLYPETLISNYGLGINEGELKNYYLNDPRKFIETAKKIGLEFDNYNYQNFVDFQDELSIYYSDQINESIRDSTMVFILIHGFRKPFTTMDNTSSVDDNSSVKNAIYSALGNTNDLRFIEVYWNGTYDCCFSTNTVKNKRIFKLFEIEGQDYARKTGLGLRKIISQLDTDKLNIITHSLGAQVGATVLFNAYSQTLDLNYDVKNPSQNQINICLIAPAMSAEPFSQYYDRNTSNEFTKNDNYSLSIIYNEDDFVLKKKRKFLGPGAFKFGETSLGCNCKNEILELEELFRIEFPNSELDVIESFIGKNHLFKSYVETDQFKNYVKSLK